MSADHGTVDDGPRVVEFELELAKDRSPMTLLRPVRKAIVDGLPRTESLRQVTPRQTGFGAKENGFDEETIAEQGGRPGSLSR